MNPQDLKKFVEKDMRMSHIYQPVMLMELLRNNGQATVEQIAQSILQRDPTQIDYYSEITKIMVGKVLTKRGIVQKHGDRYILQWDKTFTEAHIKELTMLLENKIQAYEKKRKDELWSHRRSGRKVVPGSVRYQVLKRAQFHCELCGIPASKKNLEVDHIQPKSKGGKDELSNYQALCYTCNAQKSNKDSTDFRNLDKLYETREIGCLFCHIPQPRKIIEENDLALVIRDAYPVTQGHTLVIPKRHAVDYFELTSAEVMAINQLILNQEKKLSASDKSIEGFNIGINCGEVAGQTIFHCHVHLIPRRSGDVESPEGGIRNVISGKGSYRKKMNEG